MHSKTLQVCGGVVLLLAGMAFLTLATDSLAAAAQTKNGGPIVRFAATTENVVNAHNAIRMDLFAWSSDADRGALLTAWTQARARAAAVAAKGATSANKDSESGAATNATLAILGKAGPLSPRGSLYAALEKAPTLGYVWSSSEITGYAIHYAAEVPQRDGGQQIILITDRRLGDENNLWNVVTPAAAQKVAISNATQDAIGSDGAPNQYDEFSVIELHLDSRGRGEGKISANYDVAINNAAKVIELPNYKDLQVVLANVQRHDYESKRKES